MPEEDTKPKWEDVSFEYHELVEFCERHAKKRQLTTRVLNAHHDAYNAFKEPIGQYVLSLMMTEMNGLLDKIIEGQSSYQERCEYKVLRKLFKRYSDIIISYYNAAKKVKAS